MISSKLSPSVIMGEIASHPNELSVTGLAEKYGTSRPTVSLGLNVGFDRGWVELGSMVTEGRGSGSPRRLLQPSSAFWVDFKQINDGFRADLTVNEHTMLTEAIEAGSLAHSTSQEPDSREHIQARATLLGGAALLSERYVLENYGWFKDSQAMLSFITVKALIQPRDSALPTGSPS